MHYEILDKERMSFLPKFKLWQNRFYLAGGTALALQYGHRDSVDFDFFTSHKNEVEVSFMYYKYNLLIDVLFDSIKDFLLKEVKYLMG